MCAEGREPVPQVTRNDADQPGSGLQNQATGRARYGLALLPLLLFGGFALVAGKMLYDQDVNGLDISAIPSALIGTKAPSLSRCRRWKARTCRRSPMPPSRAS